MLILSTILFSIIVGVLPAIIWLLFWLEEDSAAPEPRKVIFLCFIYGILAVPLVIPFQRAVSIYFLNNTPIENIATAGMFGILSLILWATIEEIFKFGAVYRTIYKSKEADQPIDVLIYLITASLGFAAGENFLFILGYSLKGDLVSTILAGNLRFIGATLLHVISSATLGAFIAFNFFKTKRIRAVYAFVGILSAIVLHTTFNFLIINSRENNFFKTFILIWIAVIILIVLFEKIKKIKK